MKVGDLPIRRGGNWLERREMEVKRISFYPWGFIMPDYMIAEVVVDAGNGMDAVAAKVVVPVGTVWVAQEREA